MVIGPNMQNFRTITRTFLSHEAAVQVPDAHALKRAISDLLEDSNARTTIGRKAKEVVEQNVGAIERSLEMITAHPALKSLCTSSKKQ